MSSTIKAKSNGESLENHIHNCIKVFAHLKDVYPGLDKFADYPNFYVDVFSALFFHDFGKGATGFQISLNPNGPKWHYRHEILSIPFIDSLNNNNLDFVKALVLTHHKDTEELSKYVEDEDHVGATFADKLAETAPNLVGLNEIIKKYPFFYEEVFGIKGDQINQIDRPRNDKNVWEEIWKNTMKFPSKLGILGKGMINSCDYLASSGLTNILKPLSNLSKVYNFTRMTSVQKKAISIKGNAMILSPTGSGKTEASLFWATNNLNGSGGNRVFYILPYIASINAMYKRLYRDFEPFYEDNFYVSLLHGKATYYLSRMVEKEDLTAAKSLSRLIYSPYKVMTPFQILKHLFAAKGYEMGLLEMYRGRFIFDEIHSYDAKLIGLIAAMCEYLVEEYGAYIMVMSATMPHFLIKLFSESLKVNEVIRMDEKELSEYTRHKCSILDGGIIDHIDLIKGKLKDKVKVLVVCNTVTRAQEVYKLLKDTVPNSALLHSRFMLRDREEIERNLENLNLLVGTQAIEVSLDIDYDVCFTEPAPIDALVQRFGRVNRKRTKEVSEIFVFSKGSASDKYIYDQKLVDNTIKTLRDTDILTESKIYHAIETVYADGFGKSEKQFRDTKDQFRKVIENIKPFKHSNLKETDFYDLFDSIEAVPFKHKLEYLELIKGDQFIEAMKFTLPLPIKQYQKLEKECRVEVDSKVNMVFIDANYDSKIGLEVNEAERENII
jgi:CRISPR-associated endonuclease/helicase Cas3